MFDRIGYRVHLLIYRSVHFPLDFAIHLVFFTIWDNYANMQGYAIHLLIKCEVICLCLSLQ